MFFLVQEMSSPEKNTEKVINPVYQIVYTKSPIHINCISAGLKNWYLNGVSVLSQYLKGGNIFVPHASERHSGNYTCKGFTSEMKPFVLSATVLVAGMFSMQSSLSTK